MESEGLLIGRFQISRITLRQAVAELVRKQLLVRKQGKGTFVTAPAVRHDLKRSHGLLGSLFAQATWRERSIAALRAARSSCKYCSTAELTAEAAGVGTRPAVSDRRQAGGFCSGSGSLPRSVHSRATTAKLMSTEDMMHQVGIVIATSQVTMRAALAGAAVAADAENFRRARLCWSCVARPSATTAWSKKWAPYGSARMAMSSFAQREIPIAWRACSISAMSRDRSESCSALALA